MAEKRPRVSSKWFSNDKGPKKRKSEARKATKNPTIRTLHFKQKGGGALSRPAGLGKEGLHPHQCSWAEKKRSSIGDPADTARGDEESGGKDRTHAQTYVVGTEKNPGQEELGKGGGQSARPPIIYGQRREGRARNRAQSRKKGHNLAEELSRNLSGGRRGRGRKRKWSKTIWWGGDENRVCGNFLWKKGARVPNC